MHVQAVAADELTENTHRAPFPWPRLLALSIVFVLFAAIIAELALRVADLRASNLAGLQCIGTSTLLQGQKGLYVLDQAAGYAMRPETCVRLRTAEYDGAVRTNAQGLVGPPVLPNKPAGEFRVLVLGDSYAVGGQVPYEYTFPAVLERRLRDAGFSNVRAINAGVGGYTTFNEAGLLRQKLAHFSPDLVIVAAFVGNDIAENVLATAAGYRHAPEHPKGVTWGPAAARLVDESGTWFPRNGLTGPRPPAPWSAGQPLPTAVGNEPAGAFWSGTSATPQSVADGARRAARATWDGLRAGSLVLGRFFGVPIDPSVTTAPGALPLAVEQKRLNLTSFEWTILRDIPRTYWLDVAWPLFGHYLGDIRDSAASVGAPVVVLVIPEMAQFDNQMRARTMYEFRFADDELDWDRPQRDLSAQAEAAGVRVLDLLPLFRARSDREQLYLRQDTHFTTLGHQVTADELATYLQTERLIR